MGNKTSIVKTINGLDTSQYLGTVIGPMAMQLLEMRLYKLLQSQGETMTGADIKLVQFAIEQTYGTATRSVEVKTVNDQDIVIEEFGHLDVDTLRQIASTNTRRDDGDNSQGDKS